MSRTQQDLCYDLRCIMTNVTGYLELLKDEELSPEECKEVLGKAVSNSNVVLNLADKLYQDIVVADRGRCCFRATHSTGELIYHCDNQRVLALLQTAGS